MLIVVLNLKKAPDFLRRNLDLPSRDEILECFKWRFLSGL